MNFCELSSMCVCVINETEREVEAILLGANRPCWACSSGWCGRRMAPRATPWAFRLRNVHAYARARCADAASLSLQPREFWAQSA